jgi:hypothetical protein
MALRKIRSLRLRTFRLAVIAAIGFMLVYLQLTPSLPHGPSEAMRNAATTALCQADIRADMDVIRMYRNYHDGKFPNEIGELCFPNYFPKYARYPTTGFFISEYKNKTYTWDRFPNWGAAAAALDTGTLDGEYHYLGAGLSKGADPSTVVVLSDSLPGDWWPTVIVGLADGRSLQITGSEATQLKRQFSQGVRPLILRGDW